MLGLPQGEVFLVPWTEEWHKEFLKEKATIEKRAGEYVVDIHHVGSTSVKNMRAKPVLDIAIELRNFKDGEKVGAVLEEAGYEYKGTEIMPERHYLSKGEPRTHQIHMFEQGNRYLREQLLFRNYLREHEEKRKEYERLKSRLAKRHAADKRKYTAEKAAFIQSVLDKCR